MGWSQATVRPSAGDADQCVKGIWGVTGSGVAYTEQDVTPICDKNLRYIVWNLDARTRSILWGKTT